MSWCLSLSSCKDVNSLNIAVRSDAHQTTVYLVLVSRRSEHVRSRSPDPKRRRERDTDDRRDNKCLS